MESYKEFVRRIVKCLNEWRAKEFVRRIVRSSDRVESCRSLLGEL